MRKLTIGIDLKALTRRQFLKIAAGGLVAAGTAALPFKSALAQSKLNVGYMKIGDLSPFFLAMEKAFFKEAGLEINLASMVGGAAIMPALASGSINIGWSNVISVYQGHLQGLDYRLVANGAINKRGTNDVFGVCVNPASPIKSARDLAGRTVAVNTLRNIMHGATAHWIDSNGGDSSKVKWIEIPFPQMPPALANKQIDAYGAVEPFVTVPVQKKQARLLGRQLGAIAPRLLIASYFGSEAWVSKNVPLVKAFVAALNRGIDAHNANLDEARAVLAKHTGHRPELFKNMPLPAFEKALLESDLQPMLDVALRYKLIDRKFSVSEVISKHVRA
ncbi:MAG: ABC transporter substrate-binding protein [Betaproteobacteria bacterium]|nr:ABC transporter substrate-binding protein [Betaproteobacteria bacterium]